MSGRAGAKGTWIEREGDKERKENHALVTDKWCNFPAKMILRDQLQSSGSRQMETDAAV